MAIGPDVRALEAVVVRRPHSFFSEEMVAARPAIKAPLCGSRVLVVVVGSIASITTRLLLPFGAGVVHASIRTRTTCYRPSQVLGCRGQQPGEGRR
jgi:hypothetical protein